MPKALVSVLALLFLAGCGSNNSTNNSGNYSYCYNENGCSTGTNVFSSLAAMCKALAEDDFNRGCALESRQSAFNQQCSGSTWDSSNSTPQQSQTESTLSCSNH